VNTSTINQIFSKLSKAIPAPQSDLQYVNHYTLLVAVVLSAQSTDAQVNKATKDLFAKYDSPEKIVKLGLQGIIPYVKSIGLFNSKAKNVIALSQILIEKHHSKVPENFDMLCELPGVGRKTANVVMSVAFGHTTIAVDTHVYRLSRRLNLSLGETPDAVEKDLMQNCARPIQKDGSSSPDFAWAIYLQGSKPRM
jgi:endonuclease-3